MHGIYLFVDGIDLISVDSINKSEFDKEMSTKKTVNFKQIWACNEHRKTDSAQTIQKFIHFQCTFYWLVKHWESVFSPTKNSIRTHWFRLKKFKWKKVRVQRIIVTFRYQMDSIQSKWKEKLNISSHLRVFGYVNCYVCHPFHMIMNWMSGHNKHFIAPLKVW